MDLYLVRHAAAGERDPERWPDDSLRPLTKNGIRRFKRAASGIVSIAGEVDLVLASPYQRAWHTALILEKAGWPAPVRFDDLVRSEPGALLRALRAFNDVKSIALVGHEPHLSRFAAALLGGRAPWGEMKKGALAGIRQDSLSLSGNSATLRYYLPPKVLRKL